MVVAAIDLPVSALISLLAHGLLGIAAILITGIGLYCGIILMGDGLFGRGHDIVERVSMFVLGCIGFGLVLIPVAIVLANLGVVNIV